MISNLAFTTTMALNYIALMQQAGMPNAVKPPAGPPVVAQKAAVPEIPLHPVEKNIIERTNAERERRGLRRLIPDLGLLRSARRHGSWMTRSRRLQHTTAPVGENIAMGQNDSAEAVRSWMNSSGHRANMLNSRYTRVGAAAYTANNGRIYWVIQFQP
jgi:uncharacterized protein YkwD